MVVDELGLEFLLSSDAGWSSSCFVSLSSHVFICLAFSFCSPLSSSYRCLYCTLCFISFFGFPCFCACLLCSLFVSDPSRFSGVRCRSRRRRPLLFCFPVTVPPFTVLLHPNLLYPSEGYPSRSCFILPPPLSIFIFVLPFLFLFLFFLALSNQVVLGSRHCSIT